MILFIQKLFRDYVANQLIEEEEQKGNGEMKKKEIPEAAEIEDSYEDLWENYELYKFFFGDDDYVVLEDSDYSWVKKKKRKGRKQATSERHTSDAITNDHSSTTTSCDNAKAVEDLAHIDGEEQNLTEIPAFVPELVDAKIETGVKQDQKVVSKEEEKMIQEEIREDVQEESKGQAPEEKIDNTTNKVEEEKTKKKDSKKNRDANKKTQQEYEHLREQSMKMFRQLTAF